MSDIIVNPSECGEVFILNFDISKVNEQNVKKEDKEDIRFVTKKFGFLFSAEENDSLYDILEKENNLSRIYNTLNSGYRNNGSVLITIKNHTPGQDMLLFFPLQATKIIEGDDLFWMMNAPGMNITSKRKNALYRIVYERNDQSNTNSWTLD